MHQKLKNILTIFFNNCDILPNKGAYKNDEKARVIDQYKLQSNNCTTLSVCGVSAGLDGNRISYRDRINHPKFSGEVTKFVTSISPDGLWNQLNEAASLKQNNIIKR